MAARICDLSGWRPPAAAVMMLKDKFTQKNGIKSLSSGAQADGKLGNLLLEDIKYISGASEQNGVEVLSETSEGETKQKTLFTNALKPKSSL